MLLSDTKIKKAKIENKSYRLSDGNGLFMLVHHNGSKYWRFRYTYLNREKMLAFGVYPQVLLADARKLRDEARALLAKNIDPSEQRKQEKLQVENDTTFKAIASQWCEGNKKWSAAHREKVKRTLELHVYPVIGNRLVSELSTRELLVLLKKVENKGITDVAIRLQQRVISIMRYAVQHGYIDYNPAQDLSGVVSTVKVNHRAALDFDAIPELMRRIDNYKGRKLTKLVIKLSLLTFIRSSEMRFARWAEIDFERKLWTLPAERERLDGVKFSDRGSKMKTAHLIPLSEQALTVLSELYQISGQYELICIGDIHSNKPMSENTINKALQIMGYDTKMQVCGHGFRSMACSALVESNVWSRDAIERQMSHQERNGVRAAYIHKAQHLEERVKMMQWWADYLDAIKDKFIMPYEFKTA